MEAEQHACDRGGEKEAKRVQRSRAETVLAEALRVARSDSHPWACAGKEGQRYIDRC